MFSAAIAVFEGVEELDFVGPWEVFGMANYGAEEPCVHLIAADTEPVRCAKGLRVVPNLAFEDCPDVDVLLFPGGRGVRKAVEDRPLLDWIAARAPRTTWMTSVCTGSGLLVASGVAHGKRVVTHWSWREALAGLGPCEVLEDVRYVRDGQVVTAAGVSAGIDMALWLVGQIEGVERAREVRHQIEYDPAPPYLAEV